MEEFSGLPLKLHDQPFRGSLARCLSVFTFACPSAVRQAGRGLGRVLSPHRERSGALVAKVWRSLAHVPAPA